MRARVCVCACVCTRVRARVCARVCVLVRVRARVCARVRALVYVCARAACELGAAVQLAGQSQAAHTYVARNIPSCCRPPHQRMSGTCTHDMSVCVCARACVHVCALSGGQGERGEGRFCRASVLKGEGGAGPGVAALSAVRTQRALAKRPARSAPYARRQARRAQCAMLSMRKAASHRPVMRPHGHRPNRHAPTTHLRRHLARVLGQVVERVGLVRGRRAHKEVVKQLNHVLRCPMGRNAGGRARSVLSHGGEGI